MKPSRRIPVLVLTAAMGLGIWGLAFTYTPAAFSDGDVLSAAALNALLNDNFQAASDAVDARVDRAGDSMTGPLGITATATEGASTFSVQNTGDTGYAALFLNSAEHTTPTVAIKNLGTGPGLWVYAENGGAFFEGHTGSLSPAITIKADGTIENSVGSGLPLAYGVYDAGFGGKLDDASTSNWTATYDAALTRYSISIDATDYIFDEFTTVVTPLDANRFARTTSVGGDLLVYLYDSSGAAAPGAFSFITFAPGR
jgi:hypothetical protein